VTSDEKRVRAATLLRELGHEFVARDVSGQVLDEVVERIGLLLEQVRAQPVRVRTVSDDALAGFKMTLPDEGRWEKHQLFSDSIVSGAANPMGLGAYLWREGDAAIIEVTLGKAFEGAPGRAHGGVVAALIDETMGLAMAIQGALAFTVQLDITYRAPTPIGQPITARAWVKSHRGRKLEILATVRSGELVVAEATGLFVTVDPTTFLKHLLVP
jgi:acyl-coenzyme A thioesterase PaaI-like protein